MAITTAWPPAAYLAEEEGTTTVVHMERKQIAGLVAILSAAVLALVTPLRSQGRGDPSAAGKLEGTWNVEVTTKNCDTGVAGLPFRSMLTFARGGTMTGATANPAFQPGQRSPEFGIWTSVGGHAFRSVEAAFILFDSPAHPPRPAFQKGTQRISQTIEMKNEDEFTSSASVAYADTEGKPLMNACANAVGKRMR